MSDKFTEFEVTRITTESEVISSFCLKPRTPLVRVYVPGEYLLFEHIIEGKGVIRREYSISGQDEHGIRVTIKHETAPSKGIADGLMSTRFHTQLNEGDIVRAAGPMGAFTLDRTSTRPVVLLSGGVGLTPMVAMADELATNGTRETLFIHACENGRVHALGAEMRLLASKHQNFKTHFVYCKPDEADVLGVDYDTAGFVNREVLEKSLSVGNYEYYLCGPGPFMQAMYDLLHDMGVETNRISYEFFGPASVLKPKNTPTVAPKNPEKNTGQPMITFAKSGIEAPWDSELENMLEFAEDQGIMIDFSCRAGTCDTCKTKVISGDIEYPVEPFERPAEGYALLCCCLPKGNVELDA
jgi:ferredoxin-NADP reductase